MIDISSDIKVHKVNSGDGHCFFGYYDLSPESPDGSKILVCKCAFIDRMPRKMDELEVGYFDVTTESYYKIGATTAWSFQEGCRLQWIDDSKVIYNVRRSNRFGAVVYNLITECIEKEYDVPIYSINVASQSAVTYSFIRNKYNYAYDELDQKCDQLMMGIYRLNLITGKSDLLVSLDEMKKQVGSTTSSHWLEHAVINQRGDTFFFYHRWYDENNEMHTRFCVSDMDGKVTTLLNNKFCSHAGWKGSDCITAWGRMPNAVNSIQKNGFLVKTGLYRTMVNIYHKIIRNDSVRQKFTNDSYIIFDLIERQTKKLDCNEFISDGHCTWSFDEKYMLTDTYPDYEHKRSLLFYDEMNGKVYLLGKFNALPDKQYADGEDWDVSPMRCDLHPKQTYSQNKIYFDSVHEGKRGLYSISVSGILSAMKGEVIR